MVLLFGKLIFEYVLFDVGVENYRQRDKYCIRSIYSFELVMGDVFGKVCYQGNIKYADFKFLSWNAPFSFCHVIKSMESNAICTLIVLNCYSECRNLIDTSKTKSKRGMSCKLVLMTLYEKKSLYHHFNNCEIIIVIVPNLSETMGTIWYFAKCGCLVHCITWYCIYCMSYKVMKTSVTCPKHLTWDKLAKFLFTWTLFIIIC